MPILSKADRDFPKPLKLERERKTESVSMRLKFLLQGHSVNAYYGKWSKWKCQVCGQSKFCTILGLSKGNSCPSEPADVTT